MERYFHHMDQMFWPYAIVWIQASVIILYTRTPTPYNHLPFFCSSSSSFLLRQVLLYAFSLSPPLHPSPPPPHSVLLTPTLMACVYLSTQRSAFPNHRIGASRTICQSQCQLGITFAWEIQISPACQWLPTAAWRIKIRRLSCASGGSCRAKAAPWEGDSCRESKTLELSIEGA